MLSVLESAASAAVRPVPLALAAVAAAFLLAGTIARRAAGESTLSSCLGYGAYVTFALFVGEAVSFGLSCWLWGGLCFAVLKEYFSLADIRLQDRYAVWVAYLSIPFMLYFAAIDWYNMFIISIPVYSFLVIPFVVSLGGRKAEGAIYSVGSICFGLFLFVYCVGHLVYLSRYSSALAGTVVVALVGSDLVFRRTGVGTVRGAAAGFLASAVPSALFLLAVSAFTGVPPGHSLVVGAMIPALVAVGDHTVAHLGADLGISGPDVPAGRGRIIGNVKPMLFVTPVVLHYFRYFVL